MADRFRVVPSVLRFPLELAENDARAGRMTAALEGIADRAEAQARRLIAYRYATDVFAGDPQALDLVARLAEDWTGDGPQLVTVVCEVRRAATLP